MATYCDRDDIEAIYGRANVAKWADLDNTGNATLIASRISYACDVASEQLDSMLIGGPYGLPFEEPYPVLIVDLAARLAAYRLYQGRAADDEGDGKLDFASIKKEVMSDIAKVRAGTMRINGLEDVSRVPRIVDA